MKIPIPWGLILIFISLSLFYYYNQKRKNKKEDRRDKLNESRQDFLNSLLESKKQLEKE